MAPPAAPSPWDAVLKLATESYRAFQVRSPTGRLHLLEIAVGQMMHGVVVLDGQVRGRVERNARPNGSVAIHFDGPDGPVPAEIRYRSLLVTGGVTGVSLVVGDVVLYRE
jgi:hypothetical protein